MCNGNFHRVESKPGKLMHGRKPKFIAGIKYDFDLPGGKK